MNRTYVVTGAASGIGAATTRYLRERGGRVITSDLHHAEVIADLATREGRGALVEGVSRLSRGKLDAIVANAGGGPPETCIALNFFGAVATLEGLRPLLSGSLAPRAVAVSSIASLRQPFEPLVEACLGMDEPAATAAGKRMIAQRKPVRAGPNPIPADAQGPLDLYGNAKHALQRWCRRAASKAEWAGAGIALNVAALGFFDTTAAASFLSNSTTRDSIGRMVPMRGAFPGRPEEAAALLAWCVSPENSQMTGQVLYFDGGFECLARGENS